MSTLVPLVLPLLILVFGSASAQSRVRICYFTNRSQGRSDYARFLPSNIDPFLCTHITFAFADINDTTNSLQTMSANDLQLYVQVVNLKFLNPDLKVLLAVGGYDETQALNRRFETVAGNNASTDAFARNVITSLRQNRFDGLDVDWEWPDESTRTIFQSFMQRIRAAFDNEATTTGRTRLLLTVAVNANHNTVDSRYQPSVIAPYVDYIEIMSFEYFGIWEPLLAHHSPLYISGRFSMHQSVQAFLTNGAPRNKLVLGFATYGRAVKLSSADLKNVGNNYTRQWASSGRLTQMQGVLAYYEICEKYLSTGWTREFLGESQVPIAYSTTALEWVCYDEPVSFTSKAEYVVNQNLAGAMVRTLDLDDFSSRGCGLGLYPLTSAIKDVFERNATPPPTTPRTSTTTTTATTTTTRTTATALPPTTLTTARTTTTLSSTTKPTTIAPTTATTRATTPAPTTATTRTTTPTPTTTRTTTTTPSTATTTTTTPTQTTRATTPTPTTTTTLTTITTKTTTLTPTTSTTTKTTNLTPTTTRTTTLTPTTAASMITTKPTTMTTSTPTTTASITTTRTTITTRPTTVTAFTVITMPTPATTTTPSTTTKFPTTTITTTTTPLRTTTTSKIATGQPGDTTHAPEPSFKPVYDGGYNCPTTWGQYAYPGDCNRFVICVFGTAYQFTCAPYRHYSDSLQVCVWPYSCDRVAGMA